MGVSTMKKNKGGQQVEGWNEWVGWSGTFKQKFEQSEGADLCPLWAQITLGREKRSQGPEIGALLECWRY